MKAKISVFAICVKAIIYLLLSNLHDCTFNGPFISDHPRNEIHFISPAMKSDINRICLMVG